MSSPTWYWNGTIEASNLSGNVGEPTQTVVPFSTTPTFTATTSGCSFQITLTDDVSSSTFTNGIAGQIYTFEIIQDEVGGWLFAWASNINGGMDIEDDAGLPGAVSVQAFLYDGTNLQALTPGMVNP